MISVEQAEKLILDLVQPLTETETVDLNTAINRILAASVTSELDFPYWDNSAMDGYAVRYKDVENTNPSQPISLTVIEEIPAGKVPQKSLKSGETARIYTGAMLPEGADTIVIQENTQQQENQVLILQPPAAPQDFVRHKGSFYQAHTPLLQPGIRLNAPEIAVLATAQCTKIPVYRRPRVAILSTGDELITPDQPLLTGQIIDSNQYALTAFVVSQGAVPIQLGIVGDDPQQLRAKIATAINSADVVLSTGGVSVGAYDYVEEILADLGGEIQIQSVAVKPGKPLTVAKFSPSCLYFGIPGNPVSALVSCWRFVQPALAKLSGIAANWSPMWVKAKNKQLLRSNGQRETYLWGKLEIVEGYYQFELAGGSHSSGNLINLAQTNALAVIPIGQKVIEPESEIRVMLR
jgi:molybdopterin molybdotransferase